MKLPGNLSPKSPVGALMIKILETFPDLDVEQVRREAGEALNDMGGSNRVNHAWQQWLKTHKIAKVTQAAD